MCSQFPHWSCPKENTLCAALQRGAHVANAVAMCSYAEDLWSPVCIKDYIVGRGLLVESHKSLTRLEHVLDYIYQHDSVIAFHNT